MNMREPSEPLGDINVATADGVAMTVTDVPEAVRFESRAAGELVGYITYRHSGKATFLVHVVTESQWQGRGVATAMTTAVLGLIRRAGRSVVPRCPFVADFLARHPEMQDLV
ncbi:MAG: GNAT family N-acetyltransferase, partial [Candidatus Limnocylindria bacterium]